MERPSLIANKVVIFNAKIPIRKCNEKLNSQFSEAIPIQEL